MQIIAINMSSYALLSPSRLVLVVKEEGQHCCQLYLPQSKRVGRASGLSNSTKHNSYLALKAPWTNAILVIAGKVAQQCSQLAIHKNNLLPLALLNQLTSKVCLATTQTARAQQLTTKLALLKHHMRKSKLASSFTCL